MTPSRAFRIVHPASGRVIAIIALLVVLLRGAPARADNFDELLQQLSDGSDKVRLSAALNLTKLGDPRAIVPLINVLNKDTNYTVRGTAAVGLGALVTDKTPSRLRKEALDALNRAASDPSDFVKNQADRALRGLTGPVTPPPSSGAIYVNIGPMSSKTGDAASDAKLQALMARIATKTMGRAASGMATTWPGGAPTKAVLDARGAQGFYVDGTLNELKVKEAGSSTMVSCKINMLLASYPDKSIFALLNGGASVQATGSMKDIALAREDCVSAVVEDLIAKKIVPTIKTKAAAP